MADSQGAARDPGEPPRLKLTERAAQRIEVFRARQGHREAWISVSPAGLQGTRLTFTFALVEPGNLESTEVLVWGSDQIQFVAPRSVARQVVDSVVDADPMTGALSLVPQHDPASDPRLHTVQALLDEEINPAIEAHGGYISLLDIDDGVAYVQMGGGCQGCGMAEVTLSQGVKTAIMERFAEIRDVVDTTDHALGTNPYYQASKK